jgi:carbon storage regulator
MLILSRQVGERIYIGDNIVISVEDIDRGKIRIGIEAPKEVKVFREELLRKDQTNGDSNREANGERPVRGGVDSRTGRNDRATEGREAIHTAGPGVTGHVADNKATGQARAR